VTAPAAARWEIGGRSLRSRLLLGTARYPSLAVLQQAVAAAGCEIVTISLRRESASERAGSHFWTAIKELGVQVLPNTAGCKTVKEALTTAEMGREIFETPWVKLEVIGDDYTLQPHPFLLVEAAEELCRRGFQVFPYTTEDLVIAERLAGDRRAAGSGRLFDPDAVGCADRFWPGLKQSLRAAHLARPLPGCCFNRRCRDRQAFPRHRGDGNGLRRGVGQHRRRPRHRSDTAFGLAVESGRLAHLAGAIPAQEMAEPSTPVTGTPFWHQA